MNQKGMQRKNLLFFVLIVFACIFFIYGCGGGGGRPETTTTTISGVVSKGRIMSGNVTVYALADGNIAEPPIFTDPNYPTDSNGGFAVNIDSYQGDILIMVTGGKYRDEADPNHTSIQLDFELKAYIPNAKNGTRVAVTPWTTVAAKIIEQKGRTRENIVETNILVSDILGGLFDIIYTIPSDMLDPNSFRTDSPDEIYYGLALSMLSQMVNNDPDMTIPDALNHIVDDIIEDPNTILNQTGSLLYTALGDFLSNQDPAITGISDPNSIMLFYALQWISLNSFIPAENLTDVARARALIADLRNTFLTIYNYKNVGVEGIMQTPVNRLFQELFFSTAPELIDTINRTFWIICSVSEVEPGAPYVVSDEGYTLTIYMNEDRTQATFNVVDESGEQIDTGQLTINHPDMPTEGQFHATLQTATGNLVASLNFIGTMNQGSYTSMTFTGSMSAPDFSIDFRDGGRKLFAAFKKTENDFYPAQIFLSGNLTTAAASLNGTMDLKSVWALEGSPDWEFINNQWQQFCEGEFRPKEAVFSGSFEELQDGVSTGVKFMGTMSGKWENAETYSGCIQDSASNFPQWYATFDGAIQAPFRPTITTFLKVSHHNYGDTYNLESSYTRANVNGTTVFLRGNGVFSEKEYAGSTNTYVAIDSSFTNQEGLRVAITYNESRPNEEKFTGTIKTAEGTSVGELYTLNGIPMVKYIDQYFESIF